MDLRATPPGFLAVLLLSVQVAALPLKELPAAPPRDVASDESSIDFMPDSPNSSQVSVMVTVAETVRTCASATRLVVVASGATVVVVASGAKVVVSSSGSSVVVVTAVVVSAPGSSVVVVAVKFVITNSSAVADGNAVRATRASTAVERRILILLRGSLLNWENK